MSVDIQDFMSALRRVSRSHTGTWLGLVAGLLSMWLAMQDPNPTVSEGTGCECQVDSEVTP